MSLFIVSSKDISELSDSDLRTLIGRLCEAELNSLNLPVTAVSWGGDQRAADGGIDVKVDLKRKCKDTGEIPSWLTGIQVKQERMSASKIANEMCPKGILRESIREILTKGGAYIIASGSDSTSDEMLQSRMKSMEDAISKHSFKKYILDFYDCNRIASWTNKHPSAALWVKNILKSSLIGWQPYNNWCKSPGGINEEYLIDDKIRVIDRQNPEATEVDIKNAIDKIRSILTNKSNAVRITGLSGVGKTRFVQALFDKRIGSNPLPQHLAIYADISDSPSPTPYEMASNLIASKTKSILIIDNCPPDLHERLKNICRDIKSTISLLTVEYDVRDDIPEETNSYLIEPSSNELIEKIIMLRYKYISHNNASRIADFSDGNSKLALSLASTVEKKESIISLRNNTLFTRLFQQRHEKDTNLQKAAEVCSLVYSFNIDKIENENSEVSILSEIAEMTARELYRQTGELKRRQLVQQRGVWRAVLPQAMANRLAKMAIENIPIEIIEKQFNMKGRERLLKSFSRRLGFLHDMPQVILIAKKWLGEGGILENVSNLNDLGISVFLNIAPIDPKTTLDTIEKCDAKYGDDFYTSKMDSKGYIASTLRKIAYDNDLFKKSVNILVKFVLKNNNKNTFDSQLSSLFMIYLSGTHATIENRLEIIDNLLKSKSKNKNKLGAKLLDVILKTSHFTTSYSNNFGARPRDYGLRYTELSDVQNWYIKSIRLAKHYSLKEDNRGDLCKKVVASNIRGLYSNAGIFQEIKKYIDEISQKGFWSDGWISIRRTLKYEKKNLKQKDIKILSQLEKKLSPKDLEEMIISYATSSGRFSYDLSEIDGDDDISENIRRVDNFTEELGRKLANSKKVFNKMLTLFVRGDSTRLIILGRGLALETNEYDYFWEKLTETFIGTPKQDRNTSIFRGFINGSYESNIDWANKALDIMLSTQIFNEYFAEIQCTNKINTNSVKRIKYTLKNNICPMYMYSYLAWGRQTDFIKNKDLYEIINLILLSDENGFDTATEILYMKLHSINDDKKKRISSYIRKCCHVIITNRYKEKNRNNTEYKIGVISNSYFSHPDTINLAKSICKKIQQNISKHYLIEAIDKEILSSIAKYYPEVALNIILNDKTTIDHLKLAYIDNKNNFVNQISRNKIISWCSNDPKTRYDIIASHLVPYITKKGSKQYSWKKIALEILSNSHNADSIINKYIKSFIPSIWSGSRATEIEKRMPLLNQLIKHKSNKISSAAKNGIIKLNSIIQEERNREKNRQSIHDERFE